MRAIRELKIPVGKKTEQEEGEEEDGTSSMMTSLEQAAALEEGMTELGTFVVFFPSLDLRIRILHVVLVHSPSIHGITTLRSVGPWSALPLRAHVEGTRKVRVAPFGVYEPG